MYVHNPRALLCMMHHFLYQLHLRSNALFYFDRSRSIFYLLDTRMKTLTKCFQRYLNRFAKMGVNQFQVRRHINSTLNYLNLLTTIIDLLEKIECGSRKPHPKCELLKSVWDIKSWLEPYRGDVKEHSRYHVFRFTKTASKVRLMHL